MHPPPNGFSQHVEFVPESLHLLAILRCQKEYSATSNSKMSIAVMFVSHIGIAITLKTSKYLLVTFVKDNPRNCTKYKSYKMINDIRSELGFEVSNNQA